MSHPKRVHLARAAREVYRALDAFSETVGAFARDAGVDERLKEIVQLHASQLNGCAFCVRVHVPRALAAGVDVDTIAQIAAWRESGVFSERERAGLELAEAYTFIHDDGIPDDVYERVRGVLDEREYAALSWLLVSINSFNRVAIAGRYPVPPREGGAAS